MSKVTDRDTTQVRRNVGLQFGEKGRLEVQQTEDLNVANAC